MKKENVIKSCYSLFKNITPLSFDCGKICNRKCCGGDGKIGMLLFPGEENLIDNAIAKEKDSCGNFIALCDGKCNRNGRPLSCRIYPLFPILKKDDGKAFIEVVLDPRADCPLCEGEYKITRSFIKAVKRTGKFLLLNEETAEFYESLSAEVEDIIKLKSLLS